MSAQSYQDFLRAKGSFDKSSGFAVSDSDLSPILKPHQKAIVRWACHKGRAAIFAAFGLGKSLMQLELARLITGHEGGRFLIVCPLGVRQEFARDAKLIGIETTFIRRLEEADASGIYLTNYESVRDGKLDPRQFSGISLDEAAVLRGFGGTKTFREFMRLFEGHGRFKFVATATPSPNEYIELLSYAAFLDVMDVGQAKTRFFKRDSTKADKLTLHAHKTVEFYLWLSTWAVFLQRPSQICRCECHNENNCKDSASGVSLLTHGSQPNADAALGSAAATAAGVASRPPNGSCADVSSVVDVASQSTEARERGHSQSGTECVSVAAGQNTRTGKTTAAGESPSANAGSYSPTFETTWASRQREQPSNGGITPETMSPEIATGQAAKRKRETLAAPFSSPTMGEPKPSQPGPKNSESATGCCTPDTKSSDGPPSDSSPTCCRTCRCDDGYVLPEMQVHWHELPTNHRDAGNEPGGQGRLLRNAALGVVDASREKRDSLAVRLERMVLIVQESGNQASVVPQVLPEEQSRISEPQSQSSKQERIFQSVLPQEQIQVPSAGTGLLPEEQRTHQRTQPSMAGSESRTLQDASATEQSTQSREDPSAECGVVSQPHATGKCDGPQEQISQTRTHGASISGDAETTEGFVCNLPATDETSSHRSPSCNGNGSGTALSELQHSNRSTTGQPRNPATGDPLSQHQWVIWCDLNKEQHQAEIALARCGLSISSIYGSLELDERETRLEQWRSRDTDVLLSKAVMLGSGVNLQQCNRAIFLGINFQFASLIQAIHRVQRFLQKRPVRIDLIYTEAEREVRRVLEQKWEKHKKLVAQMGEIIRQYGLASNALHEELSRSIGVMRTEVTGERFTLVHNDSVLETQQMNDSSVGLILTSPPFSSMYEYSPSYNDFGHTDSNDHFFEQMDFLTPELFRVLQPGRVAAIHVKDRIVPGGLTGLGFQTVYPFHSDCIRHYEKHGFAFLGMKTIVTDVVRENNQTYRLGWTEQCKDGSRMGVGMPEYLLLFRKPPTDSSNGYADVPVVKDKAGYSRSRWQVIAHALSRSSGDRLLTAEDIASAPHERIFKLFRKFSRENVYDFEHHVALSESLERCYVCGHIHSGEKSCEQCPCRIAGGRLPTTFMLFQTASWHPDVWTDVARMRTLNSTQAQKGKQMHLCAMQLDIANRVIEQMSMPGEVVFDPFMGIGTVAHCALRLGRRAIGCELSEPYFLDSIGYCKMAEARAMVPTLFELLAEEEEECACPSEAIIASAPTDTIAPSEDAALPTNPGPA